MTHATPRAPRRAIPAGALAALLFAVAPLSAQEVELRWKYAAGDEHVYRTTTTTEASAAGFSQNQTMTGVTRVTVVSVSPEGAALLRNRLESMRLVMETPMGRMEFDSETGVATGPMADMVTGPFRDMLGHTSEMTVMPDGSQQGSFRSDLLNMDGLMGSGFPKGPVAPGAEWEQHTSATRTDASPMGAGGVEGMTRYTLREIITVEGRRVARIELSGSATTRMEASAPGAGIMGAGSMPMEITGELDFDVDRGVVLRQSQRMVMTLSAMGENVTATTTMVTELVR